MVEQREKVFQKLLKAEAERRVRMYNLQSAKKLRLGRNLTGNSTCPSTRDKETESCGCGGLYRVGLERTDPLVLFVWGGAVR